GGVAVRHVDVVAPEPVAERGGRGPESTEVEGHDLEPRVAREAREHRAGPAADQHAMPVPRELPAQVRDRHGRAGFTTLMRQLQDRERPAWHATKGVILFLPFPSRSPPISRCQRRVTAVRNVWSWRWCA